MSQAPVPALGPYQIGRLLGEGTSAQVYLAQDQRSGAWVALKVLSATGHPDGSDSAEFRHRFLQEAEVIMRLKHPDIVTLHEAGETDGALWLAMELAPGCSLQRYAHPRRLLPAPVVLGIGMRVAHAMAHAHDQGVVHRDIKPSNVLVDLVSDGVKLTDFGTAHLPDSRRTGTELILGSPVYMAPELLASSPASAASDLYSLGVLLFELLTGALPHQSASLGELLRLVAAEPAPDLRLLRPSWPGALADLVARLLAKQPGARPASAADTAADLARVLATWPAPAGAA